MTKIEEFLKADALKTFGEESYAAKRAEILYATSGLGDEIRELLLTLGEARDGINALMQDMRDRIDVGDSMGKYNASGGYKDDGVYVFPWGAGVQFELIKTLAAIEKFNPAIEMVRKV